MAKRYRFTKRFKYILVWIMTVAFSVVFLANGHARFSRGLNIFNVEGATAVKAKVTEIVSTETQREDMGDGAYYETVSRYFVARIRTGELKGIDVLAVQVSDNLYAEGSAQESPVEAGDSVVLYNYGSSQGDADWLFGGHYRLGALIWLGAAFCILLIVFGRSKGVNTIVSLGFTCLAVFAVFLPAVLSGYNVYKITLIVCIYTIIMTLLITEGPTQKALTTIVGCSFGVLSAALLELLFDHILRLTGIIDEHSIYLTYLDHPIDLNALIFAMVTIGAMGAVMDVAMDISSSLHELHQKAPQLRFSELFASGLTIGRDIMGTMANTLVLAYIGSSLCSILLMISYSSSLMELLNREGVVVDILNALIGSLAILLTIPLTAMVCGVLYTRRTKAAERSE